MYHVLLSDGQMGYVKLVCSCAECIKRGEIEFIIQYFDGKYMTCLKYHELFDKKTVIMIANDFKTLSHGRNTELLYKSIADMLHETIVKKVS